MRSIKGVLFDFDGLILDTELPDYQSWQDTYREYGYELPLEKWVDCIGTSSEAFNPYNYLEKLLGQPLERKQIRDRRRKRFLELVERQQILPGVQDYLNTAKQLGLKIGLASSSPLDWVSYYLKRLNIYDDFHCIKTRDDVNRVKPHPALYLKAMEALDLQPEEVIALEDSPNGILAAKEAGIFCAAVPNFMTCRLNFALADIKLVSLADILLEDLIAIAVERSR